MKLATVTLSNFRRFTNLTIREIPETTRLIILAGPNGCGKSSLFDAFVIWHRRKARPQHDPSWDPSYHAKMGFADSHHHGDVMNQISPPSTRLIQPMKTNGKGSSTSVPPTGTTRISRCNDYSVPVLSWTSNKPGD